MEAHALQGKRAVVTGGSSGLGRATAVALADAGADVAVLARSAEDLEQTCDAVRERGHRARAVPVDLADADACLAAAGEAASALGGVDILVNAAGTDVPGPVSGLSPADWDRVLDVNLRASFLLAHALWPHLVAADGATVVNVSSVAGRRGWAGAAVYCVAKFGLTGFTQALAAEGRPHRIRAAVVYPGAMDTSLGLWDPAARRASTPTAPDEALPPEQVAELIVWMAAAPPDLVLNEVTVTPLDEQGWP
jgi:NAD(P)-dependent dehydrogenase (short-subunit alcohol dehydrogenase family)